MGKAVVHFELNGPDPEKAAQFYSDLFGWHIQEIPDAGYWLVDTHAGWGINGGIGRAREGQGPSVIFYVEVDDLQKHLEQAETLGGKTVVPVTDMGMVVYAAFTDPQGAVIGLVGTGDQEGPGVSAGDNPGVGWFEVLGSDPKAAWGFYRELFGWEIKESAGEGFVYGEADTDSEDRGISGGIGSSSDGQARVNIYTGVDDVQKYAEKAESLGGKTIMGPTKVAEDTEIALFADPQGTTFGLYRRAHQPA